MQYRHLGSSGLRVSSLGFGTWLTVGESINQEMTDVCVKESYDGGINFFDTAEAYAKGKSEISLGKAIKKWGFRRENLVVSTKLFWGEQEGKPVEPNDRGLSRKHIVEGLTNSLKRLQLDYVDLIYAHRPDITTPMEETVRAFDHVINKGMAFYWGTSEWTAAQLMEAYQIAKRERLIPPTMEQPEYNMLTREKVEKEYLPLYKSIGLGLTTWSPLKYGLLTGKYNKGTPSGSRVSGKDPRFSNFLKSDIGIKGLEVCPELSKIADELGCTLANLAIAWCMRKGYVSSVILGATNVDQLKQNLQSVDIISKITPEVEERIEKILNNKPKDVVDFRER